MQAKTNIARMIFVDTTPPSFSMNAGGMIQTLYEHAYDTLRTGQSATFFCRNVVPNFILLFTLRDANSSLRRDSAKDPAKHVRQ